MTSTHPSSTSSTSSTAPRWHPIPDLNEPATAELFYSTNPAGEPLPVQEIPEFATIADLSGAAHPGDDDLHRIDPASPETSFARTVSASCARRALGTLPALDAFRTARTTLDTAVCDLLTDLLHAADVSGIGADVALARARRNYDAETRGE